MYKTSSVCFYELYILSFFSALEIVPDDPKALYRRCQAYEKLNKAEEAYKDAAALMKSDPKNTAVQPILKRLNPIIQEKVILNSTKLTGSNKNNFESRENCAH